MFRFCLIWNPQTIWIFLWRLQKYQNLLSGRAFLNFRYVQLIGYPIYTFVFRIRAAPKNKEKRSVVQESQGRVGVLDGRQPAFVLRLALRSLPLRLFSHYFWELLIFQIFKCFGYFCDIRVLQRPHQRKRGAVYAKDSVG